MKSPFGVRLWILIAALFLLVGGIIYGLAFAERRIKQLEARLTASQLESFQFAGEIRHGLGDLIASAGDEMTPMCMRAI